MVRLSFATRLKELATELFDMREKDRKLLQDLGAALRAIDGNVWVRAFGRQVRQCESLGQSIVVDDLRFRNEYNCLRDLGFTIIRLDIPPDVQLLRLRQTYPSTYEAHLARIRDPSEIDLDDAIWDHVVSGPEDLDILLRVLIGYQPVSEK